VVAEFNTVACRNLTLTRFDRFIAELDHFAAVEANQVIVVMLLGQFEHGFPAFEVMTRHDAGVVKLVQNTVYRRQTNLFAHVDQAFVQIFRTDMMGIRFLKHFQDF